MENLEISGKTVEEAIKQALQQLGVTREEVEVTVLKEGRSGILGIGAEDAVVSVSLKTTPAPGNTLDVADQAKAILETLLSKMDLDAVVTVRTVPATEEEEGSAPVTLDVSGEDLGILIGRRGQTLSALQYIVRIILAQQTRTWVPVIIDIEEYRLRYEEKLRALAWRMAEQVRIKGIPISLRPMPAYERRIVHMALADHPAVTTESTGEGESRMVNILPKQPRSGPKRINNI